MKKTWRTHQSACFQGPVLQRHMHTPVGLRVSWLPDDQWRPLPHRILLSRGLSQTHSLQQRTVLCHPWPLRTHRYISWGSPVFVALRQKLCVLGVCVLGQLGAGYGPPVPLVWSECWECGRGQCCTAPGLSAHIGKFAVHLSLSALNEVLTHTCTCS